LIGEKFLSAKEISEERIEEVLLGLRRNLSPIVIQPEEMMNAEKSIIERFKSLGPIPVVFGGLIDGINPCAFATLIFLVSYLTLTGRKREEVLKVGLGFTGAVFLTYLLIGLGLISFIQHFSFTPALSRGIYLLASVFALVMGGLSSYDFLMWKKGKEKEMKLQLPRSLKRLIHKTIRGVDLSKYQMPGVVFLGFIVSLFEFTCTGQVYLPTIIFVMSISELWINGFFYLLLYNFAFIIPLLSVFSLFYLGVRERRFGLFLQKRGALIKLLTSVFFFLLGAVMLATIF
jgi:cytochrome c biogenesis protein CcdA